ncbi:MAG: hypothetical protein JWN20_2662 [Jatrophihabitantaceae bacterium]|nr:hypothetical protein [Jatrophihabitantaceae bacterium]
MIRPGGNHVDRRRKLTPREYLTNPHGFGRETQAQFLVPPGGDGVSAEIARVQHALVLAWRSARPAGSGSQDARAFGVSPSTWSRSVLGERWLGETVMAAVLHRTVTWLE